MTYEEENEIVEHHDGYGGCDDLRKCWESACERADAAPRIVIQRLADYAEASRPRVPTIFDVIRLLETAP